MDVLDSIDSPILPRSNSGPAPLSAVQSQMWNGPLKRGRQLTSPRLTATSVCIVGPLNISILCRCIEAVTQRHESLRTRIVSIAGEPKQHIDARWECHLDLIDLTSPPVNIENEARAHAQSFMAEKVDVSVGPLLKGKLLKLNEQEHVLLLALDHIVSDGTSNMILSREIWALYKETLNEKPAALSPLPVQFADYAAWQHRTLDAWLEKHDAYWRGRLIGAPYLTPPCDAPDDEPSRDCPALRFPLGMEITTALRAAARRERAPLFTVVLTMFTAVMARWCKQDDFVVAFMSHGRHRPELANMIGCIASRLYLRITMSAEDSLLDLLRRIELELRGAYEHQDHGRVPALYFNDSPPDIVFNWAPSTWSPFDWKNSAVRHNPHTHGDLQIHPFAIDLPSFDKDLISYFSLAATDTTAGIILSIAYRPDRLSSSGVNQFLENVRSVSEQFAAQPRSRVSSLQFVSV